MKLILISMIYFLGLAYLNYCILIFLCHDKQINRAPHLMIQDTISRTAFLIFLRY